MSAEQKTDAIGVGRAGQVVAAIYVWGTAGFLVTLDAPGRTERGGKRHVGVVRKRLRDAIRVAADKASRTGMPIALATCATVVAHANAVAAQEQWSQRARAA